MWKFLYGSQSPSYTIESISSPWPMRYPVRAFLRRYGAFDIDSIPPATARSYSPARMPLAASITARMPEPQTLWSVTHGTESGMPAPSDAWRAGACPIPAWSTFPKITASTSPAATPAAASAARIAVDPSCGAVIGDSEPRNEPIGVLDAERMTTSPRDCGTAVFAPNGRRKPSGSILQLVRHRHLIHRIDRS